MFQYAFGYALSQHCDQPLNLDLSTFESYELRNYALEPFNFKVDFATLEEVNHFKNPPKSLVQRLLSKVAKDSPSSFYQEPFFHFDPNALQIRKDTFFVGYWQSEKYFLNYREDLLKQFTLPAPLSDKAQKIKDQILDSTSVSLHIRRGDYVSDSKTKAVHGVCSLEYYKKGMERIQNTDPDATFFIFSDDLAWAKENLDFINKIKFVGLDKNAPDQEEVYLMSQCKHNIIANSSFSWWGAWLNENKGKIIIAPKQWFQDDAKDTKDLIPDSWVRIWVHP